MKPYMHINIHPNSLSYISGLYRQYKIKDYLHKRGKVPIKCDFFDQLDTIKESIHLEFELPEGRTTPRGVIEELAMAEGWPDLDTALAELPIPRTNLWVIPYPDPNLVVDDSHWDAFRKFMDDESFGHYLMMRDNARREKQPAPAQPREATADVTTPDRLTSAIMLAYCGQWNYRSDLPPLFTRKRLNRSCRLVSIDLQRYYGQQGETKGEPKDKAPSTAR